MAQGNITFPLGSSHIEERCGEGKTYVKVYNHTGSTIANGAIKVIVPMWITGIGVVAVMAAPATSVTDTNLIGIVADNNAAGILTLTYGWVQTYGIYGSTVAGATFGVATSGSVAANAQLQVLNAGTAFVDAGAIGGAVELPESSALAVALVATNVWQVFLYGKRSGLAAT